VVAAIGSTVFASSAAGGSGGQSPVALQAQLDRFNQQLGEWISCPSGKTPQGQKIIQSIEEKISAIKAQIQVGVTTGAGPNSTSSINASASASGSTAVSRLGSVGTQLNTFA